MNKEEFKSLLEHYDSLYYNQDTSEISDTEYDALRNSYIKEYGEYNYVPGEASKDSKKYNHTTNVSSLDKVQITDIDKLKLEIERLWPVIIQPKVDGITMVSYHDADVTRGNGNIGENVTENMKKVSGTGNRLKTPIRSEIVMLISEFNKINKEREKQGLELLKNPRNAAAGMMRQLDSSKVKGLKAFAYNMIYNEEINDQEAQILSLNSWNWNTVLSYKPKDIDDALCYINTFDKSKLDYEIDGLVVKHSGNKTFGYTTHHPKSAIAIKFEQEGVWTTVTKIVNQLGRTGRITPVVEFEPIELLGSTVTRATLHNYGIMKAIKLTEIIQVGKYGHPETQVKVIKANEIIPAIIEIRNPDLNTDNIYAQILHEPTCCPECEGKVEKVNDQLFCINSLCSAKVIGALVHMSKRDAFDIEGLSEETAIKLVDFRKDYLNQKELSKNIHTELDLHPKFIFDLSIEDLSKIKGFAKKSAEKLYNNIQKSKNIDFNKFLYGCGIPLVGRSVSKDIATFYSSKEESSSIRMSQDYYNNFKQLRQLPGIGIETINSLNNNWSSHLIPYGNILGLNIKDIEEKKKAVNQLNIVITGKFDISRDEIKVIIEDAGHKVSGSVSKKTDLVLASLGEEDTSKYKKAIELEITIINTIEELKKLI